VGHACNPISAVLESKYQHIVFFVFVFAIPDSDDPGFANSGDGGVCGWGGGVQGNRRNVLGLIARNYPKEFLTFFFGEHYGASFKYFWYLGERGFFGEGEGSSGLVIGPSWLDLTAKNSPRVDGKEIRGYPTYCFLVP